MVPSNHSSSNPIMTSAEIDRLPLKQIEAALHKTTEALAAELVAPSETTPDWTELEWCMARAVAAMHGVSPLLSSTLRWRGPESWESFLQEQRQHTLERHQRIARLLADIGARAVRDDIAIVPLKGAALHDIGIYRPGERPMSDIDLLVRSTNMQATARLLNDCGYHESCVTWKHWVFEPETKADLGGFGEHALNPIKIELHTRVVERMPVVDRDISAMIFPPLPSAGLNSYPSISALMVHLLTHAAGCMCFSSIRLLHLHDIASLARRMTSSDWEAIFKVANNRAPWWVSPPLMLTAHYYPSAIPAPIVARAASDCSWLLRQICRRRTLSDVSLSNLWIQAFPGIEWSHSAREIFNHVMSRVNPDREVLVGRKETLKMHPSSARFSWPYMSQWQRMVRWVFRRPPRVETLACVCAALAQLNTQSQLTQHS